MLLQGFKALVMFSEDNLDEKTNGRLCFFCIYVMEKICNNVLLIVFMDIVLCSYCIVIMHIAPLRRNYIVILWDVRGLGKGF